MEVNYFGMVFMTKYLLPSLRRYTSKALPNEKARIINVASIAGI